MRIDRRFLLIAIPLALLIPAAAAAAAANGSWDGAWTGMLHNMSPITVTIAQDKVVSYAVKGVPFDIQYSKVTPKVVSFGDRDHYFMKITRTGDTTASAVVHGRLGYGSASLVKQ
jgi:hypothetical protein